MLTGFEVYGAIGASVALLVLASQGLRRSLDIYRDYQKFGHKLVRLEADCSVVYFQIEEWRKSWGLHQKSSDELYQAFWSEQGWDLIQIQVAAIESGCADLAVLANKLLRMTPSYNDIPEDFKERVKKQLEARAHGTKYVNPKLERASPRNNGEARQDVEMGRIRKLRVLGEFVTRCTPPWTKARLILGKCEEIEARLEALDKRFTKLRCLVNDAWSSQHQDVDPNISSFEPKRVLGLLRVYKLMLKEAEDRKDRPGMSLLYGSCTTSRRGIMLDMNLVKNTSEDPQGKLFRILIPKFQGSRHLDISAHILHGDPPAHGLTWCDQFDDAIGKVHEDGQGLLRTHDMSVQDPRRRNLRPTWFKIYKNELPSRSHESEMLSLAVRLNELYMAERLNIAYSIVESGLLLFGTSWLSALSSTTLKRLKPHRQAPRYIVDVKDTSNSLLTQLQNESRSIHLYIFTIGALLVEVALGNAIKDVARSPSGLELCVYKGGTLHRCSLRSIVSEVEHEMGNTYSNAVKFCLQDPVLAPNTKWKDCVLYDPTISEEQLSMELLGPFYDEVFIP